MTETNSDFIVAIMESVRANLASITPDDADSFVTFAKVVKEAVYATTAVDSAINTIVGWNSAPVPPRQREEEESYW